MEVWKIIPGYENYEASSEGNIRNFETKRIMSVCKNHPNKNGYYQVGQPFFDTTINVPVYWDGSAWITSAPAGTVTAVTGTSPIASSGGTTPDISIAQANASTNGYLSYKDWNTFNNKQAALTGTSSQLAAGNGSAVTVGSGLTLSAGTLTASGGGSSPPGGRWPPGLVAKFLMIFPF